VLYYRDIRQGFPAFFMLCDDISIFAASRKILLRMNVNLPVTGYKLQSLASGKIFDDRGWTLDAPGEETPTLIRAVYESKQIGLKNDDLGLYKFADWLPIRRTLNGSSAPVTFRSYGLADKLGLENLFITFSGWWPERGGLMKTCSFKETEAYSVCARLDPGTDRVLVVASAGNTARSFARVCSDNSIRLLLCVPEDTLEALWFDEPLNDCVKLVASRSGCDYYDSIHLAGLVCKQDRFIPEGGAKNVARRDGMGTTVLSAAATIGVIPSWYFQAVGSGTGAIAAWEANLRLLADGRFGSRKMKLMLSQNAPFLPIHDAWKAHSRELLPLGDDLARQQVMQIIAKVLSNRRPPYAITGGLYDALTDAGGDILAASNDEALRAAALFEETEGIDIHPAAAVALASLISTIKAKRIGTDETVMLNITGGGEKKFRSGRKLFYLKPSLVFGINPGVQEVVEKTTTLFG
jgi:cysteate synthase